MNTIREIRISGLKLPIVWVILFTSTVGSVFAQTQTPSPTPTARPDLAPIVKLLSDRQSEQALNALKGLLKYNNEDAQAWYYMGIVQLQLSDFKKAASAFENTIKLQPDMAAAHSGYSYALMRRARLKDAKEAALKALELEPRNVDALYTMGIISLRSGSKEDALKYADALLAVQPDFAEAYLIKSEAFVRFNNSAVVWNADESKAERNERYRAAAAALEQYLKLSTQEADLWRGQLETLKVYIDEKSGDERIYSGRDVTTKVQLISKPEPQYTNKARSEWVTGRVTLRCVFASDGTVKHLLVVESLPHGLTEVSIAAAKQIRFVPATINGNPVSTFMQLEYNFALY